MAGILCHIMTEICFKYEAYMTGILCQMTKYVQNMFTICVYMSGMLCQIMTKICSKYEAYVAGMLHQIMTEICLQYG